MSYTQGCVCQSKLGTSQPRISHSGGILTILTILQGLGACYRGSQNRQDVRISIYTKPPRRTFQNFLPIEAIKTFIVNQNLCSRRCIHLRTIPPVTSFSIPFTSLLRLFRVDRRESKINLAVDSSEPPCGIADFVLAL